MKTSLPRTFSLIFTIISPSEKFDIEDCPSEILRYLEISFDRAKFDLPENNKSCLFIINKRVIL
jgi:hypothetical protein